MPTAEIIILAVRWAGLNFTKLTLETRFGVALALARSIHASSFILASISTFFDRAYVTFEALGALTSDLTIVTIAIHRNANTVTGALAEGGGR